MKFRKLEKILCLELSRLEMTGKKYPELRNLALSPYNSPSIPLTDPVYEGQTIIGFASLTEIEGEERPYIVIATLGHGSKSLRWVIRHELAHLKNIWDGKDIWKKKTGIPQEDIDSEFHAWLTSGEYRYIAYMAGLDCLIRPSSKPLTLEDAVTKMNSLYLREFPGTSPRKFRWLKKKYLSYPFIKEKYHGTDKLKEVS